MKMKMNLLALAMLMATTAWAQSEADPTPPPPPPPPYDVSIETDVVRVLGESLQEVLKATADAIEVQQQLRAGEISEEEAEARMEAIELALEVKVEQMEARLESAAEEQERQSEIMSEQIEEMVETAEELAEIAHEATVDLAEDISVTVQVMDPETGLEVELEEDDDDDRHHKSKHNNGMKIGWGAGFLMHPMDGPGIFESMAFDGRNLGLIEEGEWAQDAIRTRNFQVGFRSQNRMFNSPFWYSSGLMFSAYSLELFDDRYVVSPPDERSVDIQVSPSPLTASSFNISYLEVPFMLLLNASDDGDRGLRLGAGVYAGMRMGVDSEIMYLDDLDREVMMTTEGHHYVNRFNVGLEAELGYNSLYVKGRASLSPLFDQRFTTPDVQLVTLSAGINL